MRIFAKVSVGAVVQVKYEGIYMDLNFVGVVTDVLPEFPIGLFMCRAWGIQDEYIVAGDMVSDIILE